MSEWVGFIGAHREPSAMAASEDLSVAGPLEPAVAEVSPGFSECAKSHLQLWELAWCWGGAALGCQGKVRHPFPSPSSTRRVSLSVLLGL